MKRSIMLFSAVCSMSLSAMRGPLAATVKCLRQQTIKELPKSISCAKQLQDIFEKADSRYHFNLLAKEYLEDYSIGKKGMREISVFQAFSDNDLGRTRDVFTEKLNAIAGLWVARNKQVTNPNPHSFYRYLTTKLFNEHALPFEISHPQVSKNSLQPGFYFGKTIRSVYDDATYAERVAFEKKKNELSLRLEEVGMQNGIQKVHEDFLAMIQEYYSEEAYHNRILLTAAHIANYPSGLVAAGARIDQECEALRN